MLYKGQTLVQSSPQTLDSNTVKIRGRTLLQKFPLKKAYETRYLNFTDQLFFGTYYISFCKIANICDIDLKFSGLVSDVNMDNPAKFREVGMPRKCIFKNRDFRNFGL